MNPPAQPTGAQPPAVDDTPFKTDVVQNIPMQVQASSHPLHDNEDVELDLMMQDVGQELKKNVKRAAKHHFFSKKPKETEMPQPALAHRPAPMAAQQPAPISVPQPQPQSQNQAQPAPKAPAKPKAKQSVPVFIILVTIIITSVLVVLAVAASKQK